MLVSDQTKGNIMAKIAQTLTTDTPDYSATHRIGVVDDCYRCIYCEIGSWNAWKEPCPR